MQCKDYQKLLHSNRPGELDESQAKMIEAHLKVCPTCLKKQQQVIAADLAIARLREMQPVLSEPAELTNIVMSQIEASTQKERKGFNKLTDAVLDFLSLLQVRFALSLITISLLGTLLVEQIFVLNQVAELETRMASGQAVSNKYYTTTSSELAIIFNPGELRSMINVLSKNKVKTSNDLIYFKKSTVESWAKKLDIKEEKLLTGLFGKSFLTPEKRLLYEALNKVFAKKSKIIDLYKKQLPNWRK